MPYLGFCQDSSWRTVRNAPGLKNGEFYRIREKDTVTIIDPEADNTNAAYVGEYTFGTNVIEDAPGSKKTDTKLKYIEQMPQPPYNIESYLANQTKCPISQFNSANKKRVNVQFLVKADGSINDVKVITRLHPDLDSIAKQAISNMPRWKPGKQNGKQVEVYFTQPIYFDTQ